MKIGIDISVLCNKWDGIGTYTNDVLQYIHKNKDNNEYFLYADRPIVADIPNDSRFHLNIGNGNNHLEWLLFKLPKLLKREVLDVFWQPNFILPYRVGKMRNVITVCDMSAYAHSVYAPKKTNIVHKLFLKPSCKKAAKIMVISHDAKEDLLKHIKIPSDKVKVIYLGRKVFPDGLDANEGEVQECFYKYRISKNNYFLFVGTLSPRKNDEVMLNAYIRYKELGGKRKLVLAGNIAEKSKHCIEELKETPYSEDIVVSGYVSEKEKRILYYNASALLFPSRLEGFGFPVLEGMKAQIPVITSRVSSLPEVGGDAAFYLEDINDSYELCMLMQRTEQLNSEEKAVVKEKGIRQVNKFETLQYENNIYEWMTK